MNLVASSYCTIARSQKPSNNQNTSLQLIWKAPQPCTWCHCEPLTLQLLCLASHSYYGLKVEHIMLEHEQPLKYFVNEISANLNFIRWFANVSNEKISATQLKKVQLLILAQDVVGMAKGEGSLGSSYQFLTVQLDRLCLLKMGNLYSPTEPCNIKEQSTGPFHHQLHPSF